MLVLSHNIQGDPLAFLTPYGEYAVLDPILVSDLDKSNGIPSVMELSIQYL